MLHLLSLASITPGLTAPLAGCDNALLTSITSSLVAAQTSGNPATLAPVSSDLAYFENNRTTDITKGILFSPQKIDFTRSQHDTTNCSAYTEIIITDSKHPYMFGRRSIPQVAPSAKSKPS